MSTSGSSARDLVSVVSDDARVCTTVTAVGEVDAYTLPLFVEPIDTAISATPTAVVLDLTGVTFFSAAALRGLLDAREKARRIGVRLAVAHGDTIGHILEATATRALLNAHPSVRAARSAIDAPTPGKPHSDVGDPTRNG